MNDIQIGDIIKVLDRQVQILYIPQHPQEPWVVKDVLDGKKWRIHTQGPFTRTYNK